MSATSDNLLLEWAQCLPQPPVLTSAGRNWKYLQASRVQHPANSRVELPPLDAHYINMHMSGPCDMFSRWNGVAQRRRWVPGEVTIVSANQTSVWEWTNALDELHIYLDPRAVADAAAQISDRSFRLLDDLGILDPVISEIAFEVNEALTTPHLRMSLFDESIAQTLIARVLNHYSSLRDKDALSRMDIASYRLRTALEYMDTHLDCDLTLQDIAQVVNMSPFHFARGFCKAMGRPPHRYLLARRIDRAKNLLRRTETEVAELSRLVGFSTQSHFGAAFRKQTGMSPGQYRRAVS